MLVRNRKLARAGLTLMELLVVLVVLIGLAGIVTPMLPNVLNRTHTSTAASNMSEIARCIGEYQGLHLTPYPDGWDTLLDTNGNVAIIVQQSQAPNAPVGDTTGSQLNGSPNAWFGPYALNKNNTAAQIANGNADAAALSNVGINTLFAFAPGAPGAAGGPADPTFYPYGFVAGPTPTSLDGKGTVANPTTLAGGNVAQLTPAAIAQLGLNPAGN